ncbi:hypothetical protein BG20_I0819 [Candidatus Nitrosarchaeum limnium BG20]|uniref:Uncharacterized protein n=1 Tax=Candidatus Nitrosarchaeum limnium BG20 TaxID=859192 RepID=S2EV78_9ARCH|nr:hypothetical protein BG20_I0819 [Candidatus Nitrosarchaeum limnium BG20]
MKYYQNPDKVTRGRTSSQNRGLGAIIDANIVGKVIELGVNEILKQHEKLKEFSPDMEIRSVFEYGQPDVVEIVENGVKRKPKCFVEVKNSPKNFEWVGLYTTQFEDMKKFVGNDEENIYIIYASLRSKEGTILEKSEEDEGANENKRENDLLGIFLKSKKSLGDLFNFFEDASNFSVNIDYVITGKELADNGKVFPSGEPWPSPEIFQEGTKPYDASGNVKKNFKRLSLNVKDGKCDLPTNGINNSVPFPHQFGTLECHGDFQAYEETKNSWRKVDGVKTKTELKTIFIDCKSDVVVKNKWLGEYHLEGKKVHRIKVGAKVASKDRDDLSYPKRNIESMVKIPPSERIKELARKI